MPPRDLQKSRRWSALERRANRSDPSVLLLQSLSFFLSSLILFSPLSFFSLFFPLSLPLSLPFSISIYYIFLAWRKRVKEIAFFPVSESVFYLQTVPIQFSLACSLLFKEQKVFFSPHWQTVFYYDYKRKGVGCTIFSYNTHQNNWLILDVCM